MDAIPYYLRNESFVYYFKSGFGKRKKINSLYNDDETSYVTSIVSLL